MSCKHLILLAIISYFPGASLAQQAGDVDHAAIEDAVRGAEADAADFAASVAARAEAYADEALALTDSVNARLRDMEWQPDGSAIDLGAMLQSAPQISEARDAAPPPVGVLIFASFAMPEDALRALVLDAKSAEIPVVLRGFAGGSLTETARKMRNILGDDPDNHALGGVLIDPRAFRVFDIVDVPVFVATDAPLPDCDGLDCSAPAPAHDRIAGNMSLTAALTALATEGDNAKDKAGAALDRLEGAP
ncbi:MAG: type-F conjugative transfer system pilin assembly protein TrbC [Pseudomonadota bacterium]